MAKRDQGEPTMPLSPSQFLPPKPPPPQVHKNDASVWKGLVVGADDFAPVAAKKQGPIRRWMIFGGVGALAAAVGIYAFYPSSESAKAPPPTEAKPAPAVVPTPTPPTPAKAAVATPAVTAPTKPAVETAPVAKADVVDAVSSADPPMEKPKPKKVVTTKKPVIKKVVPKKKGR